MEYEFLRMGLDVKSKLDGVVTPELKKKVAAWWLGTSVNLEDVVDIEEPLAAPEPVLPDVVVDMSHYIKVCERLWGDGLSTPGGEQFIDLWGQQLSLNKEKSTAFLGAGLGGHARALNISTGSWVSGFERKAEMIEVAADQSMMAGLAKKVTTEYYDPEKFELAAGKFDTVIAKEEFFTVDNKQHVIDAVSDGMRTGALFMFTEYVATEAMENNDRAIEIFGTFLGTPSLWTEQQYVQSLEKSKLDIHVNEELSDKYVEFINGAWAGYQRLVEKIRNSDDSAPEKVAVLKMVGMMAETWTHIAMALDNNEIEVRRFMARKI